MEIYEVVKSFSSSDVEKLCCVEKLVNKAGDIVGVTFSYTDSEGIDYCFTLSKDVFNSSEVFGRQFASEIKHCTKSSEVSVACDDTSVWCARASDCIEQRGSNFDWVFDSVNKFNYTLIEGGKYSSNDVIMLDVCRVVLDALEACRLSN